MRTLYAWAAALCALTLISCSEATTPSSTQPTLTMTTSMDAPTVTPAAGMGKGGAVQNGSIIDSMKVTRVRVLISRIKLKTYEDNWMDEFGDWRGSDVKAGPAVLSFSKDGRQTFFSVPVPVGKYERVKLEMHKFNGSEADSFRTDSIFSPFIEPERVTVIVDGIVYIDTTAVPFTISDDETSNFWIDVFPYFEVTASSNTELEINFDAVEAFRIDGRILDPRDAFSRKTLHGRMHKAFRCHRR